MDDPPKTLCMALLQASGIADARAQIVGASAEERIATVEPLARELLGQLRSQPHRAALIGERIVLLAEATRDPLLRARAAWVRGHALGELLRHDEAMASYRKAERLYRENGGAHQAALVCIGQVNVLRHMGADRRALRLGERARGELLRQDDPLAAARLDANLASIHHRHERWAEALRLYDRALRLARRAADAGMERVLQFNRAAALVQLGRLDSARDLYETLRGSLDPAREQRLCGYVDFSLGTLALRRAEYDRAFAHLDEARACFEALEDPHYLLETMLELAGLLLETRAFVRAGSMAEAALERARAHDMPRELAQGMLLQGMAELGMGNLSAAERCLGEAANRVRKVGQPVSSALCLLHQAELAARAGRYARAAQLLERASQRLEKSGARLMQLSVELRRGHLACRRGRLDSAELSLRRVRRMLRRVPSRWLSAQAHALAAGLAEARGDPAGALRHHRRAIDQLEATRRRLGLDELRASFDEDAARLFADPIVLLLRRGTRRDLREAFTLLERSRARAQSSVEDPVVDASPRARSLRGKIRRLQTEIDGLLGTRAGHAGADRPRIAWNRVWPLVRRREEELADLYQRLARTRGARIPGVSVAAPSLADVSAALPCGVSLVEYFVTDDASWAFLVRNDAQRVVRLGEGRAALDQRVQRLRFQLEKRVFGDEYRRTRRAQLDRSLHRILEEIASLIWEPLELGEGPVWLIPHGPLHGIPFAALPTRDGVRVLERHQLLRLANAGAVVRGGVLPGTPYARALVVGVEGEGLEHVGEEIEAVTRTLQRAELLRGRDANRAGFAARAPGAELIHVATHGAFRPDDPWFSALRLDDGWLNLYELHELRLDARLVTLSSCQSGPLRTGEQLTDLATGFLRAGARNLLVSLWSVDDRAAARLMARFYENLSAGSGPASALRAAMRIAAGAEPDPWSWAPFVLIVGEDAKGSMYQPGDGSVC